MAIRITPRPTQLADRPTEGRPILSPRPIFPFPDQSFTVPSVRPLSIAGPHLREFCGDSFFEAAIAQRKNAKGVNYVPKPLPEYGSIPAELFVAI